MPHEVIRRQRSPRRETRSHREASTEDARTRLRRPVVAPSSRSTSVGGNTLELVDDWSAGRQSPGPCTGGQRISAVASGRLRFCRCPRSSPVPPAPSSCAPRCRCCRWGAVLGAAVAAGPRRPAGSIPARSIRGSDRRPALSSGAAPLLVPRDDGSGRRSGRRGRRRPGVGGAGFAPRVTSVPRSVGVGAWPLPGEYSPHDV